MSSAPDTATAAARVGSGIGRRVVSKATNGGTIIAAPRAMSAACAHTGETTPAHPKIATAYRKSRARSIAQITTAISATTLQTIQARRPARRATSTATAEAASGTVTR